MSFLTGEDPKVILAVLQIIGQGGLAIVVFVIWYFTFKQSVKQQRDRDEQIKESMSHANATTAEAFKKHVVLSESLLQLLKDEQDYKSTLTGILDRMEYRLSVPTQCPLVMVGADKIKALLETKQ
jgi:hypothetical protein